MKLFEAYEQALDEEDDIAEREEFSSNYEMKDAVIKEVYFAMEDLKSAKNDNGSPSDIVKPFFNSMSFFFLIGIRVGKILKDAELAGK